MEFKLFRDEMLKHFNEKLSSRSMLFRTNTDRDKIWEVYLNSFPEEDGVRQSYNCNSCKSFLRQWGNLVAIDNDDHLISLWDFVPSNPLFIPVCENLDKYVTEECQVCAPFINIESKVGVERNKCTLETGQVIYWNHLYLPIPRNLVKGLGYGATIDSEVGNYNSKVSVFKRSLDEISLSTIDTVLEIINQGSLYKGDENKKRLEEFRRNLVQYKIIPDQYKLNHAYRSVEKLHESVTNIRNSAIGTLLVDIEKGVDLDSAVTSYERITAPENYKRPKAIVTQSMIKSAQKTITELGYLDSLPRRHASISDITVNNVIYVDRNTKPMMVDQGSIFNQMMSQTTPKKMNKIEEIGIEDFIKNVIPTAQGIEVLIEGKHLGNFMTLTAPVNSESKTMFKWNNGFSWSYKGDVTDSIKQKVKEAGGNVDADVRCSLHWFNYDDLDIHVIEPDGNEIYYSRKNSFKTNGQLDIDMNAGSGKSRDAVENIFWKDEKRMINGKYTLNVHNFCKRETIDVGFECEIEYNGESHKFEYGQMVKNNETVKVAEFWYESGKGITKIESSLPNNSSMICKEEWGVTTGKYSKVSMIMYSPNYWDGQEGIGNKHYFFMIDGMRNPDPVRGFYNEYMKDELYRNHKRVFEVMGGMMKAEYSDNQLSGLGFSSTVRNELVVKVKGNFDRLLKVKF